MRIGLFGDIHANLIALVEDLLHTRDPPPGGDVRETPRDEDRGHYGWHVEHNPRRRGGDRRALDETGGPRLRLRKSPAAAGRPARSRSGRRWKPLHTRKSWAAYAPDFCTEKELQKHEPKGWIIQTV